MEFKVAVGASGLLLLATLGCLWFTSRFEQMPAMVATPPSAEALSNDYLATARILEDLGFRVHRFTAIHSGKLPAGGTLMIPVSRDHLGESHREALTAWMESGGHLIVVPTIVEPPADEPAEKEELEDAGADGDLFSDPRPRWRDPLIEEAGVGIAAVHEDTGITRIVEWLRAGQTETQAVELPGQPAVAAIGPPMLVELDFYGDLPLWHLWGDKGLLGVRIPVGRGGLTVLGDMRFLSNRYIGQADNAVLLWELVRWNSRHGDVWLVTQLNPPSLRELIFEYGWTVLVSLAVLIAGVLWRHGPRFGPIRPDPEPIRRSLMEHIAASGLFLWRHGGDRALINACQEAVRNRVRWRTPGWQRLSEEQQHERIARLAKVDTERVAAVLSVRHVESPMQFVETVQQLEKIRKRL